MVMNYQMTPIGATSVAECTYAFGVIDVNMFVATALILEDVGVFGYLTDAGSILTVETHRHVVTLLTSGYTLKAANGVATIYTAFISVTGPTFVEATPVAGGFSITIPEGFNGQLYTVLTSCNETVTDDTIAAGPAIMRSVTFRVILEPSH
ncbi:hypothetical protein V493_01088 [Pseudogymnoascus sp. VKM F-4281 (FW-2241)]|nr:hypothetical protein V493_01088 [Pseudogymnoascus sp. VKM F-4281 (FW-2241)]